MNLPFLPTLALCAVTAVAASATLAHAQIGELAGRWAHSGVQRELVVQPRVKLQPYVAPGHGFTYGGSAGNGSATATTVLTEGAPSLVTRKMTLEIQPTGASIWHIERSQPLGKDCVQTVRQTKIGRVDVIGVHFTFHIAEGTEESTSTCGPSARRPLPAGAETYRLTSQGGGVSLTSGGVTWTFSRG